MANYGGQYSAVGKRLPRIDGTVKATGEAKYTADINLLGMLLGKILRSPYPHAKILNIETSKAERLKGLRGIITGKDTAKIKYGVFPIIPETVDEYPLSIDKVRYVGDEVAAVAAIDEETAEEALDLINVEYEELPPLFHPEEAMKAGAPKIHESEANIGLKVKLDYGYVEAGFKDSDYIREDKFQTQPVSHCPIEPHAVLAHFDSSGTLTVWSSTQSPFYLRRDLAKTLDISEGKIRVIKPYLGGGFGGKREMLSLDFCASLLSKKTGRPVKIVYTREEEFTSTRFRHPVIIHLKTGVKKDGNLVAKECKAIADGGAYNAHGVQIIGVIGAWLTVLYRLENVRYEGYLVYTNKPPCSAFRGYGNPQLRFADDSHMDMIAEDLGIDPVEIRLKNGVNSGYITPNQWVITSCGLRECIQRAAKGIGWKEKRRKLANSQGVGIACGDYVSGAKGEVPHDASAAFVKVHENGTVTLLTGASDIGQGSDTILAQIAAEELGVAFEDVKMISADTEVTPLDLGSYASRVTFMAGRAVLAAVADAKSQLFERVAKELECSMDDLEAKNRHIYIKGSPDRGLSFQEAIILSASSEGRPIMGKGFYNPKTEIPDLRTGKGNLSPAYSFGAQCAEVSVDMETGLVKVIRMTAAHDPGFAINPMAVEGQIEGSIAGGLGQVLFEELLRERGLTLNPSFLEYKVPTSMDMPYVESIIIETLDPEGPFGAKGIGEGTQVPTAPAIANAIYCAIGVRANKMPITPEDILNLRSPYRS